MGDDGWLSNPMLNETRYKNIVEASRFGPGAVVMQAMREDPALLLPRILLMSFGTAWKIPRAILAASPESRGRYARKVLAAWSRALTRVARVRLSIRGLDRLDPSRTHLFASNHSSPFDPPLAHAVLPVPAAFVCNATFAEIPVFSTWLKYSGSVLVAQGKGEAESAAFKCMIARLKAGTNLLLFPEGYIHQGPGLAEFKRGGLYAAVLAGASIVPMCVYGAHEVMQAGGLHVVAGRRVLVEISEPIDTNQLSHAERKGIDALVRERMLGLKRSLEAECRGLRSSPDC